MADVPPIPTPRFHLVYGTLSFLMGLALILGGPGRVSSHAYYFLVSQGGPYVWGVVFLVIGVVLIMSVDYWVLTKWMLLMAGICYWVMALAFLASALTYSDANLTATVAYGWIGTGHLCAFNRLYELRARSCCSLLRWMRRCRLRQKRSPTR